MRLLFEIDLKNYDPSGDAFVRPSVRAVIIQNGLAAMVHSRLYDYYKFPGGGIESGESQIDCLIRETQEESGLTILPDTVREYGYVHRIQKGKREAMFVQDNYYYLCDVSSFIDSPKLDAYEAEEQFTLEFVLPQAAIETNRFHPHGPSDQIMLEREAKVLECLLTEGYFG